MKAMNPECEYCLWDDYDNREFITVNYPWFLPIYDSFRAEIYRVDAVRYFFLYHFGGFYADMDVECVRPLAPVFHFNGVVLGRMGNDAGFEHSIPNAIMASEPREEFWKLVISLMMSVDKSQPPEHVTGPVILRRAVELYSSEYDGEEVQRRLREMGRLMPSGKRSRLSVLPAEVFYPLDWHDPADAEFRLDLLNNSTILSRETVEDRFPNSVTVTYWTHTW